MTCRRSRSLSRLHNRFVYAFLCITSHCQATCTKHLEQHNDQYEIEVMHMMVATQRALLSSDNSYLWMEYVLTFSFELLNIQILKIITRVIFSEAFMVEYSFLAYMAPLGWYMVWPWPRSFTKVMVCSFLCRLQSIVAHRDHFVRCLSVCLFGSHTFLVVTHSYVSQAIHAFLGMLPLCLSQSHVDNRAFICDVWSLCKVLSICTILWQTLTIEVWFQLLKMSNCLILSQVLMVDH